MKHKHIRGWIEMAEFTLSGVTTSQWKGLVSFFFELLVHFLNNGGGGGGNGATGTAAGLESWLGGW